MTVVDLYLPSGHPNRPGETFTPIGVVVHRTGRDVGARWLRDYFSRDPSLVLPAGEGGIDANGSYGRFGSSQYGVDDEGVFAYMPETEVAWHCSAENENYERIGIETCQYFDEPPRIRPKTYAHLVALGADICFRYGWAPREQAEDGEPRFRRHQDADPVNRPNDPGAFLRWDDYLDDVELAILGIPWQQRKVGATVEQALLELTAKVASAASSILVWLTRLQRGIDVETGRPFDPKIPPIDSRVIGK